MEWGLLVLKGRNWWSLFEWEGCLLDWWRVGWRVAMGAFIGRYSDVEPLQRDESMVLPVYGS